MIEKWECNDIKTNEETPQKQTKSYPHAIFYDSESFHDSTKRKEATDSLTYENVHVPISVGIGDTFERAPTHICDPDAKELTRQFMEELKRREKNVRTVVRREFMPEDIHLFTCKQRGAVMEW